MKIVTADQGSHEWFAARCGVPSGSRYADVMAKGRDGGKSATRQSYVVELALERITGAKTSFVTTKAMEDGVDREPLARGAYEARTGAIVQEVGFCLHDHLHTGVSPDGLVDARGLLEIKCPQPKTHLEYLRLEPGKCPSAYRWQVQGQLWVAERDWCDFASYNPDFPEASRLAVRRVYRDEAAIQELEAEVIRFLADIEREVDFILNYREAA